MNPSSQVDVRGVWKQLWGLSVQNKIKTFLWRACKDAIPVKRNLVRGRVLAEDICCHCNQAFEDMYFTHYGNALIYLLFGSLMHCGYSEEQKKFSNVHELVRFTLEEGINLELFATMVWTIWYHGNFLQTSNKLYPISQVVPSAI